MRFSLWRLLSRRVEGDECVIYVIWDCGEARKQEERSSGDRRGRGHRYERERDCVCVCEKREKRHCIQTKRTRLNSPPSQPTKTKKKAHRYIGLVNAPIDPLIPLAQLMFELDA